MKHNLALLSCLVFPLLPGCAADTGTAGQENGRRLAETPVAVWYTTNRARIGDTGDGAEVYSDERAQLEFGIANVLLPPGHVPGKLEKPPLEAAGSPVDRRRHVYLDSTLPLRRDSFLADLNAALKATGERGVLLYIHGFNTEFSRSMRRAGQLAHDLEYDGVAMAFAWPSSGAMTVPGYLTDMNNADWSAPHLAETLRLIAQQSTAERIDLIAHSMGSRILIQALDAFARGRIAADPTPFNEVIFAAPDVDSDIFGAAMQRLKPLAGRFTLYVSDSDLALSASKSLAGGHPRAGEFGRGILTAPDMDIIDATAGGGDLFGHKYFGDSAAVVNDIRLLLRDGAGASQRPRLERDFHLGRSYWRLTPLATSGS